MYVSMSISLTPRKGAPDESPKLEFSDSANTDGSELSCSTSPEVSTSMFDDIDLFGWPVVNPDKPTLCEDWTNRGGPKWREQGQIFLEEKSKDMECCWGCAILWHLMKPGDYAARSYFPIEVPFPPGNIQAIALDFIEDDGTSEQRRVILTGIEGK